MDTVWFELPITLHELEIFKGEAIVNYCESLITQQMEPPAYPLGENWWEKKIIIRSGCLCFTETGEYTIRVIWEKLLYSLNHFQSGNLKILINFYAR